MTYVCLYCFICACCNHDLVYILYYINLTYCYVMCNSWYKENRVTADFTKIPFVRAFLYGEQLNAIFNVLHRLHDISQYHLAYGCVSWLMKAFLWPYWPFWSWPIFYGSLLHNISQFLYVLRTWYRVHTYIWTRVF